MTASLRIAALALLLAIVSLLVEGWLGTVIVLAAVAAGVWSAVSYAQSRRQRVG